MKFSGVSPPLSEYVQRSVYNMEQPVTKLLDGLPVSGYKPQSPTNVSLVERNKQLEELILRVMDELASNSEVDKRWLAIAKTDIEKGFMALNRSIFRPTRFDLNLGKKINVQSLEISVGYPNVDQDQSAA